MKQFILLGSVLLFVINPAEAQNSINGYVVSLETAKPIANATIFLNNKYNLPLKEPLRVTSDSTGFYSITGIKSGSYVINAWTTYHAMNQRYAMVMESNIIKINHSREVDFVFSENAFKMRLSFKYEMHRYINSKTRQYFKDHPSKVFDHLHRRGSDVVAIRADRPQIYIDSRRDTVDTFYIKKINDIGE
ncbi:MAG TPA: carboxypeptidase-like regulatory domain-containing protein [Balneolales bacterium]|nr:carboxypeptidase-like regulatory domain-containing protein [Balneolales bacterium]